MYIKRMEITNIKKTAFATVLIVVANNRSHTVVRWDRDHTDDMDIQHKAGEIECGLVLDHAEVTELLKSQNI
jgi:hypothetical protein